MGRGGQSVAWLGTGVALQVGPKGLGLHCSLCCSLGTWGAALSGSRAGRMRTPSVGLKG